ncbi:YPR036W-A [Zygosaccharomyces parabailii]|uniref:ZYBA0S06-04280g1_1 n=1 Tax=Zygosaccharomyces bailii (strain CLIB 213 / ATCC 58445 / CBS 680 / BCRC 21525 / NBRC 1098 / NCYC 1416 / NRRL Y-2227) TaxID=1333698 RepID=A0A8J2T8R0_ZYGB2|nr:YPR036W-A [Zygosaccharomyces parabailii]AQZ18723.1 YPR036W-A [Zygosaccharomyces parabailii]CDF90253.1 ZYBA0S06-04280g1_1 [Zygosaccharomyces bailii CLIB 213]SJM84608.1 uncharacterized protein ZBIST_1773 [Zygosaccharomyces bailii]
MAFLTLTSEIQEPFVIPELSPVSRPSTRQNSVCDGANASPIRSNR